MIPKVREYHLVSEGWRSGPGVCAAAGAVALTPVPESAAVCGLAPSPPLYDTLKVGVFAPTDVGLNFTVKVQDAFAASVSLAAAQDPAPEFVIGNSAESVSGILMLVAVVVATSITRAMVGSAATRTR